MSKKEKCNHLIGYIETSTYDEGLDTNFMHLNDISLSDATDLKSHKGSLFNFCSTCGKNLEGLLDKRVELLTTEVVKQNEIDRINKEKANLAFNKKVDEVSKQTKLNQLPDHGTFVVVFYPTKDSYGKDSIINGSKELILRNCVHINTNRSNPDILTVKTIYKVDNESFYKTMKEDNWTQLGEKPEYQYFEKVESNIKKQLSMESGIVYVTEYHTDSDGDESKSYLNFAMHRLSEYLKKDVLLETIELQGQ
jgi:hypothetical protein